MTISIVVLAILLVFHIFKVSRLESELNAQASNVRFLLDRFGELQLEHEKLTWANRTIILKDPEEGHD